MHSDKLVEIGGGGVVNQFVFENHFLILAILGTCEFWEFYIKPTSFTCFYSQYLQHV